MSDLCVGVIDNVTSCRDVEAFGLIVFVLASVFYFGNRSHYLPSKSNGPRRDSLHP